MPSMTHIDLPCRPHGMRGKLPTFSQAISARCDATWHVTIDSWLAVCTILPPMHAGQILGVLKMTALTSFVPCSRAVMSLGQRWSLRQHPKGK